MGKKWYCQGVILFYLQDNESKMAVVAGKKVGKAVKRNRAKRILRTLFFKFEDRLESGKYILVAKNEINAYSFLQLEKNLQWGLNKIQCLK